MKIVTTYEIAKVVVTVPMGTFEANFSADGVRIHVGDINVPVPDSEDEYRRINATIWGNLPTEAQDALFPQHREYSTPILMSYMPKSAPHLQGDAALAKLIARNWGTTIGTEDFGVKTVVADTFNSSGVHLQIFNSASGTGVSWADWSALLYRQITRKV